MSNGRDFLTRARSASQDPARFGYGTSSAVTLYPPVAAVDAVRRIAGGLGAVAAACTIGAPPQRPCCSPAGVKR
jgi:hypothetical protein